MTALVLNVSGSFQVKFGSVCQGELYTMTRVISPHKTLFYIYIFFIITMLYDVSHAPHPIVFFFQ